MNNDLLQKAYQIYNNANSQMSQFSGPMNNIHANLIGLPGYYDPTETPKERMMGMALTAVPEARIAKGMSPKLINQAAKILKGRITPGDREVIGRFAELVESGKARGNMGETGATMQSLAENIFGNSAANMSNKQLKVAMDMVMERLYGR